jgi:outer membrane lipoprotein carrier protein
MTPFPIQKGRLASWPFFCLLLSLLPAAATAQTAAPSAAQLAAAVDHHYNALHSLEIRFTETYAGMGTERSESGDLLLRKPGRMRWTYTDPPGKLFVLDGKWAWFYSPGDAQVQRIPAKELDDLRSPLRFLLGHTQLEKELDGLTAEPAGDGLFRLSGVPAGLNARIQSLSLDVDGSGAIHTMTLEEAGGARTRFTFSGEKPNAPAPDTDFHFRPPPGVPVVQGLPPV